MFAEILSRPILPPYAESTVSLPLAEANGHALPARHVYALAKRLIDIALAGAGLALSLPLLLVLAVWIKLDSRGPALFRQTRLGRFGTPFVILKLRTMSCAENGATVVQARRQDPRVTRIGRFLRSASLDELPQLINVLMGDMSLVGPRPHAVAHDRHYAPLIPDYDRRQSVKPGLTGLAQVNGQRGETASLAAMATRVAFDLAYVRDASLALDLAILLRTPLAILKARNAY